MKNKHRYILLNRLVGLLGLGGLLGGLLGGCTLSEDRDLEINQKPTLEMKLPVDERFRSFDMLIYDQQGLFFSQARFVDGEAVFSSSDSFELLAGVPPGEYRVITYANLSRATIPALSHGVSKIEDLVVGLDAAGSYEQTDSVYHHMATYVVKRGEPMQGGIELRPRYYHVDLTLRMEEGHPDPVTEFSVRLERVPGSYNAQGEVRGGLEAEVLCDFVPTLEANVESTVSVAQFPLHRFTDGHGVKLVVFRRGVLFGSVAVLPSVIGVDPESAQEQELTITFDVEADKVLIRINEWDAVIEQQTGLGS